MRILQLVTVIAAFAALAACARSASDSPAKAGSPRSSNGASYGVQPAIGTPSNWHGSDVTSPSM